MSELQRTGRSYPGRRSSIGLRAMNAACVVLFLASAVLELLAGHAFPAVLMLLSAFCFAVCFVLNTIVAARKRAEHVRDSRPRPDYARIARMEREIYGEAFRHDGAPRQKPSRPLSVAELRDRRMHAWDEMRLMLEGAYRRGGELTAEEDRRWAALTDEIDSLDEQLRHLSRHRVEIIPVAPLNGKK